MKLLFTEYGMVIFNCFTAIISICLFLAGCLLMTKGIDISIMRAVAGN